MYNIILVLSLFTILISSGVLADRLDEEIILSMSLEEEKKERPVIQSGLIEGKKERSDIQNNVEEEKKGIVKEVIATAYSNDPISINVSKWRDGRTATMTVARWGVVAVDPKVISLGSKIFIDGMGWFRAEDTGGKIKGNRIDIFFPSRKEALTFGKKKLKIRIVTQS